MNMKNRLFLFIFVNCLLLGISFLQASAFKVIDHDLEVAASHKGHHWEKGGEHDHHHHEEEEKGEKGHKGYESKHG